MHLKYSKEKKAKESKEKKNSCKLNLDQTSSCNSSSSSSSGSSSRSCCCIFTEYISFLFVVCLFLLLFYFFYYILQLNLFSYSLIELYIHLRGTSGDAFADLHRQNLLVNVSKSRIKRKTNLIIIFKLKIY